MPHILTVTISLVFYNVFLFLQDKKTAYGSLLKVYVDLYIKCLIQHFFTEPNSVREYCSILQNKRFAYAESIENSRLNYISKNRGN